MRAVFTAAAVFTVALVGPVTAHLGDIDLEDMDRPQFSSGWFQLALPVKTGAGQTDEFSYTHHMFADNFVDGQLIPCARGDCSGATTAVSQDSWGRIKASFR